MFHLSNGRVGMEIIKMLPIYELSGFHNGFFIPIRKSACYFPLVGGPELPLIRFSGAFAFTSWHNVGKLFINEIKRDYIIHRE